MPYRIGFWKLEWEFDSHVKFIAHNILLEKIDYSLRSRWKVDIFRWDDEWMVYSSRKFEDGFHVLMIFSVIKNHLKESYLRTISYMTMMYLNIFQLFNYIWLQSAQHSNLEYQFCHEALKIATLISKGHQSNLLESTTLSLSKIQ